MQVGSRDDPSAARRYLVAPLASAVAAVLGERHVQLDGESVPFSWYFGQLWMAAEAGGLG